MKRRINIISLTFLVLESGFSSKKLKRLIKGPVVIATTTIRKINDGIGYTI